MELNINIIDRKTSMLKSIYQSFKWEINQDAIQSVTSTFTLFNAFTDSNIDVGDFIIAKAGGNELVPTVPEYKVDGLQYYRTLYIGIVDAYDGKVLTARAMRDIYNSNVVVNRSGTNEGPSGWLSTQMADALDRKGMFADSISAATDPAVDIPGWRLIMEKRTPANVLDLIFQLFKDVQVHPDEFTYSFYRFTKLYKFRTVVSNFLDVPQLTLVGGNSSIIRNLKVYVRPANVGIPNAIEMTDLSDYSTSYFYLHKSGIVDSTFGDDVSLPISYTAYVYDKTSFSTSDGSVPPSKLDVATSQLKTQEYQHQITFL